MPHTRVLIVEDDAATAAEITEMLGGMEHYVCNRASTGPEALELAAEARPDVVLVDIDLRGDMDGMTAAHELGPGLGIPVVHLATRCDPATFDAAKVTAPFGCIAGPFASRRLCCAIEMALHLHKTGAAPHQDRRRLREIVDNSPAGYFRLDRRGCYVDVNRAWLAMHGFGSPDDVIGQDMSLVLPPEDVPQARRELARLLRGEVIAADEGTRRCKDGTLAQHSFSAGPVRQDGRIVGAEGFLIDMTDREYAEEALRAKQALINAIFTASPDMLILKDRNLVYQAVNPAFCKYLGKDEDEIIGSTDFDILPPEEARRRTHEDTMVMASGCPVEQDERGTGEHAETWWSVVRTPIVGAYDESDGVLVTIRDITARKKYEEARRNNPKDQ